MDKRNVIETTRTKQNDVYYIDDLTVAHSSFTNCNQIYLPSWIIDQQKQKEKQKESKTDNKGLNDLFSMYQDSSSSSEGEEESDDDDSSSASSSISSRSLTESKTNEISDALEKLTKEEEEEEGEEVLNVSKNEIKTPNEINIYKDMSWYQQEKKQSKSNDVKNENVTKEMLQEAGVITSHLQCDRILVIESNTPSHCLQEGNMLYILFQEQIVSCGFIFEIFGPVTRPLYSIKLSTEEDADKNEKDPWAIDGIYTSLLTENPNTKVYYNSKTSQVLPPSSFFSKKKGCDASNFYDEEVNESDLDYSDDELERAAKQQKNLQRKQKKLSYSKPPTTPFQPQQQQFKTSSVVAPYMTSQVGLTQPLPQQHPYYNPIYIPPQPVQYVPQAIQQQVAPPLPPPPPPPPPHAPPGTLYYNPMMMQQPPPQQAFVTQSYPVILPHPTQPQQQYLTSPSTSSSNVYHQYPNS